VRLSKRWTRIYSAQINQHREEPHHGLRHFVGTIERPVQQALVITLDLGVHSLEIAAENCMRRPRSADLILLNEMLRLQSVAKYGKRERVGVGFTARRLQMQELRHMKDIPSCKFPGFLFLASPHGQSIPSLT